MKNLFLSFIYTLLRFSLGLLLHPYQTLQLLVEEKIFIWVALMPTMILGLITIIWKLIILPPLFFLLIVLDLPSNHLIYDAYSFCATWLVVFVIYWQLLLFYLLVRFKLAFDKK